MMGRNRIIFMGRGNEYIAKNGKIDEYGLPLLEDQYNDKGIVFCNDDFDQEATMEWFDWVEPEVITRAKADFESFIKPL